MMDLGYGPEIRDIEAVATARLQFFEEKGISIMLYLEG